MGEYPVTGKADVPLEELRGDLLEYVNGVMADHIEDHHGDPEDPEDPEEPEEPPEPPEPPESDLEAENWEFKWRFEAPAKNGRYVTGDPWVVGPVRVLGCSIEPAGGLHGVAINTRWSDHQQWDKRAWNYRASETYPITLQPGQTLMATRSWMDGEPGAPKKFTSGGKPEGLFRPFLQSAATLTCVAEPPAADNFRPPYTGTPLVVSAGRIDWSKLTKLAPAGTTPPAHAMSRTWLDTYSLSPFQCRYAHPSRNMPSMDYGGEMSQYFNRNLLIAMVTQDRALALKLIQVGIDLWGVFESGANWKGDGGHNSGRLFPIVFAGHMLGIDKMRRVGFGNRDRFQELCQTYARGESFDWGGRNCWMPDFVQEDYRTCCTANRWMGGVLAMEHLGLKDDIGWEPLFGYCKWYQKQTWPKPWMRIMDSWQAALIDREWGAP